MCYTTLSYKFYVSVQCLSLTDPNNGMIICSLGDDGVPSYKDTCSFTCNTGYELTVNDTRTCQSDGSWSGSDPMCRQGNVTIICIYRRLPKNLIIERRDAVVHEWINISLQIHSKLKYG